MESSSLREISRIAAGPSLYQIPSPSLGAGIRHRVGTDDRRAIRQVDRRVHSGIVAGSIEAIETEVFTALSRPIYFSTGQDRGQC